MENTTHTLSASSEKSSVMSLEAMQKLFAKLKKNKNIGPFLESCEISSWEKFSSRACQRVAEREMLTALHAALENVQYSDLRALVRKELLSCTGLLRVTAEVYQEWTACKKDFDDVGKKLSEKKRKSLVKSLEEATLEKKPWFQTKDKKRPQPLESLIERARKCLEAKKESVKKIKEEVIEAIKNKNLSKLKAAIEKIHYVDLETTWRKETVTGTILHYAIRRNWWDGVVYLIQKGARLDAVTSNGRSALDCAQSESVFSFLLERGANPIANLTKTAVSVLEKLTKPSASSAQSSVDKWLGNIPNNANSFEPLEAIEDIAISKDAVSFDSAKSPESSSKGKAVPDSFEKESTADTQQEGSEDSWSAWWSGSREDIVARPSHNNPAKTPRR